MPNLAQHRFRLASDLLQQEFLCAHKQKLLFSDLPDKVKWEPGLQNPGWAESCMAGGVERRVSRGRAPVQIVPQIVPRLCQPPPSNALWRSGKHYGAAGKAGENEPRRDSRWHLTG
jgi:hypothetical protein